MTSQTFKFYIGDDVTVSLDFESIEITSLDGNLMEGNNETSVDTSEDETLPDTWCKDNYDAVAMDPIYSISSNIGKSDPKTLDFDGMLAHVGNNGCFQIWLIVCFGVINALSAFHYFGQTFISIEPGYQCSSYRNDTVEILQMNQCYRVVLEDNKTTTESCTKWMFNSSYNFIGIVEELGWICGNDWKNSMGQSMFFIGSMIGTLIFGVLADRFGRLHVLVMSNLLAFVGNVFTIFSFNIATYGLARFVSGCSSDTNFVMMYMLVMEYIKPNMRTAGLNLSIGVFYGISCMATPWIAVLVAHWQDFLGLIAGLHLLVIFFYLIVPESAQWLIAKGQFDRALKCFEKIAAVNGRIIEPKAIEGLKLYINSLTKEKNEKKNESFLALIRTPKLRRKTIILIFKSMTLYLCYDAVARNVNGSNYSPFAIFSYTSSTIFPGCVIIWLLQDKIGRKALAAGALFVGGIFMATVGIILASMQEQQWLTLTLTVLSRLNIVVAFNSGHQYAVELIPAEVRGQGVSVIHVAGFIASFLSPYLLYLIKYWRPLPEIILGILSVSSAICCLFLPETLNRKLPVTLEEGEEFGEGEHFYDFSCLKRNKHDVKPNDLNK